MIQTYMTVKHGTTTIDQRPNDYIKMLINACIEWKYLYMVGYVWLLVIVMGLIELVR